MKQGSIQKLQELRLEYQYSYQQMANFLGISRTFYWQLEHQKRGLTYAMAIQIAAIFQKKPDDIFLTNLKD